MQKELQYVKDFIYNDEIQSTLSNINNNVMDFNILEITGMGHYEIRHSNILGWLFDDSEHNLEYELLENFLKRVIEANKNTNNSEYNILDKLQSYIYLVENKKNITIFREKDNIDLLIVDDANKVIITIENKIFATERTIGKTDDGQLSKYEDIVNNKFISKSQDKKNGYEKYFIFLTLNLDEPIKGKEYWMIANYQMIADVIENTLSTKQDLSVKTKLVLESYIDMLKRRNIVESTELQKICKNIWDTPKYKDALEILYNYKPTKAKMIEDYLKKENKLGEKKTMGSNHNFFLKPINNLNLRLIYSADGKGLQLVITCKPEVVDSVKNFKSITINSKKLDKHPKLKTDNPDEQFGYCIVSKYSGYFITDESINEMLLKKIINDFNKVT